MRVQVQGSAESQREFSREAIRSLPEADVAALREILQSYTGAGDLADHVRILPTRGHGLLQISETGAPGGFETVAWVRDGAGLEVRHLLDNGPLVLDTPVAEVAGLDHAADGDGLPAAAPAELPLDGDTDVFQPEITLADLIAQDALLL